MPLERLFEGNYIKGKQLGWYPFTAENLLRVGLALCVYLKIHKEVDRPFMVLENLDFLTVSLSVGFMAGGGDVSVGGDQAHIKVRSSYGIDEIRLIIENMEDYELKMVESILFSRYNMPRAEGEEVGKIWIQDRMP